MSILFILKHEREVQEINLSKGKNKQVAKEHYRAYVYIRCILF